MRVSRPPPESYPAARHRYGRLLDAMVGPEPWAIDDLEIQDDRITIKGWALAPGGDTSLVSFRLNGEAFEEVVYSGARSDISRMFWFRPHAGNSAFICTTHFPAEPSSPLLTFEYVRRDTMAQVCAEHAYYYPNERDDLPLPDGPRRLRSHGSDAETSFRLEGFSAFCKIEQALLRCLGRTYRDFPRILDWGCGCGRVARYFDRVPGVELTGVDIDADNAAWCSDHLAFGRFEAVEPRPPTRILDATFDLVIGVSVFTHLREADQLLWLQELRRITKPRAIVALTVLGDHGVARGGLTPEEFLEFQERGICAAKSNADLDGVVDDADYYRNTFYSYRYIREVWGRYFRLRGYTRAHIGNMQDLLILQRA